MLKAAKMYMLLLTSMLKLNALKETTNTMQKDMICRSAVLFLFMFMLSSCVLSFLFIIWYWGIFRNCQIHYLGTLLFFLADCISYGIGFVMRLKAIMFYLNNFMLSGCKKRCSVYGLSTRTSTSAQEV